MERKPVYVQLSTPDDVGRASLAVGPYYGLRMIQIKEILDEAVRAKFPDAPHRVRPARGAK